ncbi:PP0621 family protein [Geoalkalibacter sp.]|uniref:PP0621 family protein n=1 Tax=Geoalkalibacter sp. TaxID=3041440 RepID=UPI00272E6329|nr:PP0621 family protein [Geoalkalibacter sp.]
MTRLLILALLVFLGYTLWNALRRALGGPPERKAPRPAARGPRGEDMVQDPQCGTYVPRGDALEVRDDGARHYFCSPECRDAWRAQRG